MTIKQITASVVKTLYHGTCLDSALHLIRYGWRPNNHSIGGNRGQRKYLYLTTEYDDAMWFANEKGCESIIKVSNVPLSYLLVDPEDGIADTVEIELKSIPGKVVLTKQLPPKHFVLL